jgi:hypothetical protein
MENGLWAVFTAFVLFLVGYVEMKFLLKTEMACITWGWAILFSIMSVFLFFDSAIYGLPVAVIGSIVGVVMLLRSNRRRRFKRRGFFD